MKIILLIPIILLFKFQQIEGKLNGKYRVVSNQYEEEYVFFFNDSVYKKVFQSGKEIKGVVKYGNLIYLIDYESSIKLVGQRTLIVQTDKLKEDEQVTLRNAGKDKFSFCFSKYRKDGPMNWLDICQNSGEMIKME
jgi:hypothetical protein